MHGNIKFVMYGDTSEFRVRMFHDKEPETLAWINEFSPEDVFWDIGANIGCYSLYAGLKNAAVCSFEPSPVNFYLLAANLRVNNSHSIQAFPFACQVIEVYSNGVVLYHRGRRAKIVRLIKKGL